MVITFAKIGTDPQLAVIARRVLANILDHGVIVPDFDTSLTLYELEDACLESHASTAQGVENAVRLWAHAIRQGFQSEKSIRKVAESLTSLLSIVSSMLDEQNVSAYLPMSEETELSIDTAGVPFEIRSSVRIKASSRRGSVLL